ncbi:hypothetical protein ACFE04_006190 [Oxalis oulophora]
MATFSASLYTLMKSIPPIPLIDDRPLSNPRTWVSVPRQQQRHNSTFVAKSGGRLPINSMLDKGCKTCKGKNAIECPGCKGTGRNKKNGNIFERWKCFECQGFGLKGCPNCGKGGLTPEQRGER